MRIHFRIVVPRSEITDFITSRIIFDISHITGWNLYQAEEYYNAFMANEENGILFVAPYHFTNAINDSYVFTRLVQDTSDYSHLTCIDHLTREELFDLLSNANMLMDDINQTNRMEDTSMPTQQTLHDFLESFSGEISIDDMETMMVKMITDIVNTKDAPEVLQSLTMSLNTLRKHKRLTAVNS